MLAYKRIGVTVKSGLDKKLEDEMAEVRELVVKGLAERAKAGIKVRQPLQKLKVKSDKSKLKGEFMGLIKDELNVREIVFDKNLKEEVVLDTTITPELQKEGLLREILRNIQEMRKKAGYKPKDKARLRYEGEEELKEIFDKDISEDLAHSEKILDIRETMQYSFETSLNDEEFNKLVGRTKVLFDKLRKEIEK